ncbi:phage portal protein [Clostridium luticellarii]|uniref:Phage portal protein, SPP1 Gp6-like n=1 Tax=Clostridium luticellarii TaxID=1691940 RepID=A0A2T0BLI4_9CLOT|nr:phage portal protein [Clostridium luticellarii]PRR84756.1 hypothetical protein CLLU_22950 [Clostridium luticellarii]
MNGVDVRETLLKLDTEEKRERIKVMRDYFFYRGKSISLELAKHNPIFYGQNWPVNEKLDYKPTQDIRNKTKHLLKKQARFMFSVPPTLNIKPDDLENKDKTEELRKFIEDILETNKFWKITKQAFLMATIEKRVLLRVEANPGEPLKIKYETIDNISYKETDGKLLEVKIFEPSPVNALYKDGDDKRVYYLNIYGYKTDDEGNLLPDVYYTRETYTNNEFDTPISSVEVDTGFTDIPCWLIVNGGELNDGYGESDLEDLMEPQKLYNKKNSDFADALRFQLFGAIAVIDGNRDDVARMEIRPNALHAIRTSDEAAEQSKQASVTREEYSMGNAAAIEAYLTRLDNDMRDILDMPDLKDLTNIPSAKAMRYMYNDLIARCEEKWADWEPIFKSMIDFILKVVPATKAYPTFQADWLAMAYTLYFEHNYPIPDDTDTKRDTAMSEVTTNVRSINSYLKEYSNEEDVEAEYNKILEEKAQLAAVENGSAQLDENAVNNSGDDNNSSNEDDIDE